MDIQRLRNLTTGRLHTCIADIFEDIRYLTGVEVYTHQLPRFAKATIPYLRKLLNDPRFWDERYDPTHTGEIDVAPMNDYDKYNMWLRLESE